MIWKFRELRLGEMTVKSDYAVDIQRSLTVTNKQDGRKGDSI